MTYIKKNKNGGCEQCNKIVKFDFYFNGLEFCSEKCAIDWLFKKIESLEIKFENKE